MLIEFFCENSPILARSVFVLHGHRLHRDIVVVLIASVAILKFGIFCETKFRNNWT